jgi:hypothetical protein
MHVHPVLPWNLKLQQPQLPRSEPDGQPTESSQLARKVGMFLHIGTLAIKLSPEKAANR